MYRVIFLRHGQSLWNKKRLFTGWTDVDLTSTGIKEAKKAASVLLKEGVSFDISYTSLLKRSIRTLWIVLDKMDLMWVPVNKSWKLNERHYGALQGLSKPGTAKRVGKEKVLLWRRSYDIRPPAIEVSDKRFPGNDPKYIDLEKDNLPISESLKDVQKRLIPYWKNHIIPEIKKGERVIFIAHGNSLRALIKYLDNLSDEDVMDLNFPTGIPFAYEFDKHFNVLRHYFYGDPANAEKAIERVAGELGK
jgi:2,3-bisphosphoglycerate-dependent phosphoglycerate mutase